LRLDQLRRENATDRAKQGVAPHQVQIATQLFDAVDLAATLNLDCYVRPGGVSAEQVDRPNRSGMLAAYQRETRSQRFRMFCE
jgi:hypothetical protein